MNPDRSGAGSRTLPRLRATADIGPLVRQWRAARRLSQLALALDAGTSARHLSYIETGRARPSRDMVLRLADALDVPLRERNTLLLAAGYAPQYFETGLDLPEMAQVRTAIDLILDCAPFPPRVRFPCGTASVEGSVVFR